MQSTVLFGIGTNSGRREENISRALAALSALFPGAEVRASGIYRSAPDGFESPNEFMNIAVAVVCERTSPWTVADMLALLGSTQAIERSIGHMPHRNPDGSYRDRDIDIDIIDIDGLRVNLPHLVLPHPRAKERLFVTVPLREIGYILD